MAFEQIKPEDFTSFVPGSVATYIQIERLLADIGGGGKDGTAFKRKVLQAAGWKYDALTGYSKDPELVFGCCLGCDPARAALFASGLSGEVGARDLAARLRGALPQAG